MKRQYAFIAIFVALGAIVALRAQETVFKVDVRLVRLLVTVKNSAGELVGSLDKDDFTVADNGVKQEIAAMERETSQPLSVSLLLDTSASTAKDLRYEIASIEKFLHALVEEGNDRDAVALYEFNWQVTLLNTFTRRPARIVDRLRLVKPEGGTSLYDAIYFSSGDLRDRDGRHVIVAVTDGGDTTSGKKFKDAVEAAHRADAVVYPVVVVPITNPAGRNTAGEHALETLAEQTGGRTFYPSVGESLDKAFSDILRELRTQYMISYYPRGVPVGDRAFHSVKVTVPERTDLRVSSRNGYYGDSAR
jgi:Ca-activated chloride channel homolog